MKNRLINVLSILFIFIFLFGCGSKDETIKKTVSQVVRKLSAQIIGLEAKRSLLEDLNHYENKVYYDPGLVLKPLSDLAVKKSMEFISVKTTNLFKDQDGTYTAKGYIMITDQSFDNDTYLQVIARDLMVNIYDYLRIFESTLSKEKKQNIYRHDMIYEFSKDLTSPLCYLFKAKVDVVGDGVFIKPSDMNLEPLDDDMCDQIAKTYFGYQKNK